MAEATNAANGSARDRQPGVLEVRKKVAASQALSTLARLDMGRDRLLPDVFNPDVVVASAVARAWREGPR